MPVQQSNGASQGAPCRTLAAMVGQQMYLQCHKENIPWDVIIAGAYEFFHTSQWDFSIVRQQEFVLADFSDFVLPVKKSSFSRDKT
mmetsp:Transcript_67211/g.112776  ORF Transcript_67211/g.112776 Transcript_67211/m.112776 type:complete len:86 (-) Transcript_67211:935-1192(-)